MTLKNAVQIVKLVLEGHDNFNVKEALKTLIKFANEVDKYRWHDLRKNPEDLPANQDEEQICIVKHIVKIRDIYGEDCEFYVYSASTFDGRRFVYGTGIDETDRRVFNVIAWCEIEPFEEEE